MPRFATTAGIFTKHEEYFDENWSNLNEAYFPPHQKWDYSRELHPEDVDIWEIISESTGPVAVYGAWQPFAEFYLVKNINEIMTFYGPKSQQELIKYLIKNKIPYHLHTHWVDPEDMWLYE